MTNLKTTLDGLHALHHLRGEHGSFQDALHHDSQMAHYFRGVLQRIEGGEGDARMLAKKALGFVIGQPEPFYTPGGEYIHQSTD